jgi:hypothetical protein
VDKGARGPGSQNQATSPELIEGCAALARKRAALRLNDYRFFATFFAAGLEDFAGRCFAGLAL